MCVGSDERGSWRLMRITGELLARNALLNLAGRAMPLAVSVVCLPFIVRGLGVERYGLLALIWAIQGYTIIFDLGLGRAITKFVAEALGKSDETQIPRLVWTSFLIQAIMGGLGCLVLISARSMLVVRLLKVPLDFAPEAKSAVSLLALFVPVALVSSSVSGVLQAAQRFDLVNAVELPVTVLTPLLTLIGARQGLGLVGIVGMILSARALALLVSLAFVLRLLPGLRKPSVSLSLFPRLLGFGGWVSVSSILIPMLEHLDRFLIFSRLSLGAVGYYTAPANAIRKLRIIPSSLVMSLFPAFSTLGTTDRQQALEVVFARSVKYVSLAMTPVAIMLFLFAHEALGLWLGANFAAQSAGAVRALMVGVVITSLAKIPYALLQGVGRPDITAKFHLLETPLYIGVVWFLIGRWGIVGAAVAWSLRVAMDALLLYFAAFKVCRFPLRLALGSGIPRALLACSILAGAAWGLKAVMHSLPLLVKVAGAAGLMFLFALFAWGYVLDYLDRSTLLGAMRFRR